MSAIKISIPTACHQNWDNMTPIEQGRYCSSCSKTVTDFSEMTNRELYKAILNADANLCGRFSDTQLNSDIQPAETAGPSWYKYLFSLLLPAFLLTKQAKAQGKISVSDPLQTEVVMGKVSVAKAQRQFEMAGLVIDSSTKEPVGNASVEVKFSNYGGFSLPDGSFKLIGKTNNIAMILVSAVGYESREIQVTIPLNGLVITNELIYLKKQAKTLVPVIMISNKSSCGRGIMGDVITVVRRRRIHDLPKRIITVLTDSIRIYPDPVRRGNYFNVALKLNKPGGHIIQVIDASGKIVLQSKINAISVKHNEQLLCAGDWSTGIYFLRVITNKNKLLSTTRLLVE